MQEITGITKTGDKIIAYTIDNGRIKVRLSNYGAAILNLWVPDKDGIPADIVLGYDRIEQYFDNPCNFGVVVGPSANRIAGGKVTIDGRDYQMPQNENGNNLHTDFDSGLHKTVWDAEALGDNVTFTVNLEDGKYGLPGNRIMMVSYTLTDDDVLHIAYFGTSDKETVFNPTNHSYFNLAGEGSGDVLAHTLRLYASSFTPVDDELIPTGELRDVTGTPFDFKVEKPIGRDIAADDDQLKKGQGYDINFAIDDYDGGESLKPAVRVEEPESGRAMEVWTSLPGIQLYTANYVDEANAKGGRSYGQYSSLCLETQYFPDAVHHDNFVSPLTKAGGTYRSVTEFRFG